MKHIVKLSKAISSSGLGLFLVGCDAAVDCDKVVPKQKQDECKQQQYNHTSGSSGHSSGFFMPVSNTSSDSVGS